jgi:hypothetical protein
MLKLLTEDYTYVKNALLWLESYTGKKSNRSIHELRNALDHMAIAVQNETSEEDAIKGLNAVEEHFRRAAIEPIEWIALEELQRLLKIKEKGFWWWRFLFLKAPNTIEFNNKIHEGLTYIEKGRHSKAISIKESYENFEKSYNIFHQLLNEVEPAELHSRLFSIYLSLIMLFLGGLITFLIQ